MSLRVVLGQRSKQPFRGVNLRLQPSGPQPKQWCHPVLIVTSRKLRSSSLTMTFPASPVRWLFLHTPATPLRAQSAPAAIAPCSVSVLIYIYLKKEPSVLPLSKHNMYYSLQRHCRLRQQCRGAVLPSSPPCDFAPWITGSTLSETEMLVYFFFEWHSAFNYLSFSFSHSALSLFFVKLKVSFFQHERYSFFFFTQIHCYIG